MLRLLVHWILSALALVLVAHIVPGIAVSGFASALIAALVIGLVNATLGVVLHLITLPLAVLTLGIFWFVINALMLELASKLVNGFYVRSFRVAFVGAILLSLVNFILRWLVMPPRRRGV